MEAVTFSDNQDFGLRINFADYFGKPFSPKLIDWDVKIWIYSNRRCMLIKRGDTVTSVGEINARCEIGDDLRVFMDSASGLGKGTLKCQVTAYVPNPNFPDGVQAVKSEETVLTIKIV